MASLEEEMEGMISQSRKEVDKKIKTKPRPYTKKEKEDRKWAKGERKRIEDMEKLNEFVKNKGTSKPRGY